MKQGYAVDKLLDSTKCQVLLDIGASKSFMCKFASKIQRIQVGNGQHVSIHFCNSDNNEYKQSCI